MSSTSTVGDTELILDALDFEPDADTCEYGDCDKEATHTIICPCGVGGENICDQHTDFFKKVSAAEQFGLVNPPMVLTFTNTCQHNAYLSKCTIIPL